MFRMPQALLSSSLHRQREIGLVEGLYAAFKPMQGKHGLDPIENRQRGTESIPSSVSPQNTGTDPLRRKFQFGGGRAGAPAHENDGHVRASATRRVAFAEEMIISMMREAERLHRTFCRRTGLSRVSRQRAMQGMGRDESQANRTSPDDQASPSPNQRPVRSNMRRRSVGGGPNRQSPDSQSDLDSPISRAGSPMQFVRVSKYHGLLSRLVRLVTGIWRLAVRNQERMQERLRLQAAALADRAAAVVVFLSRRGDTRVEKSRARLEDGVSAARMRIVRLLAWIPVLIPIPEVSHVCADAWGYVCSNSPSETRQTLVAEVCDAFAFSSACRIGLFGNRSRGDASMDVNSIDTGGIPFTDDMMAFPQDGPQPGGNHPGEMSSRDQTAERALHPSDLVQFISPALRAYNA